MLVLVTGSSSGIGLSAAVALASDGHQVVASMRDPSRQDTLQAAAGAAGVSIDVVPLDVTDPASVSAAMSAVESGHGPVDVLLNNAGAATVGTLEQLSEEDLARCMDLNFTGAVRMMQAVLPGMRTRGAGRIINVTSVGGIVGQPFNDAYCAAKFALEGLSESLAPVARRFGVHVSVLEPGPVATEFVSTAGRTIGAWAGDPEDPYAALFGAYIGRTGDTFAGAQGPDEVAAVILDMVRDPAPAFRWLSSDGALAFVEPKLADPTGERIVAMTSDWI